MAVTPRQPPESARALGVGLTFAVTVALFAVAGHWLDRRAGTSPLFVLVGVLFGVVGGTIHMLRILAPAMLPFGRSKADEKGGQDVKRHVRGGPGPLASKSRPSDQHPDPDQHSTDEPNAPPPT